MMRQEKTLEQRLTAVVEAAQRLRDHYGGEARPEDLDKLDEALAELDSYSEPAVTISRKQFWDAVRHVQTRTVYTSTAVNDVTTWNISDEGARDLAIQLGLGD